MRQRGKRGSGLYGCSMAAPPESDLNWVPRICKKRAADGSESAATHPYAYHALYGITEGPWAVGGTVGVGVRACGGRRQKNSDLNWG